MINLLEAVKQGRISIEDAQATFERLFSNPEEFEDFGREQTWVNYFGLNEYEATASAHGADITTLVRFRYEGWPETCFRCNKPLDYTKFHWLITQDEKSEIRLIHITCPAVS